ncbi:MAG: type IX secretion system outer membrane channel protein PorV [Flavobacteriales bacterium]|nr:type IX secretion system outer membrane channel protein PorV [Flavobacteriales bacterium]
MRKLFIILLTIGIVNTASFAQFATNRDRFTDSTLQLNTITTAVPFLLITPDSRAGAMGDAGVAMSADANSIHWNPAKLAFVDKEMGFAISYAPWLRQLVPDINLSYLSGFKRLDDMSTLAASLRYFSLGDITFTDNVGNTIGQFRPNEFALDVAYGRKLADNFSGGIALRYIYSNLTGGISANGTATTAGNSVAVDVSGFYNNQDMEILGKDGGFAAGINISNIGAKMSYTENAQKDFIPINLRMGQSTTIRFDDYNSLSFLLDFNKLLVPTPPQYLRDSATGALVYDSNGEKIISKGRSSNVSIASGMFGSFSDAPDGFKEELREFNISAGMEYWYNKLLALRMGYFNEHVTKGNRKYLTFGAGLRLSVFGLDIAYLVATTQQNPLANTIRFTLSFNFDDFKKQNKDTNE